MRVFFYLGLAFLVLAFAAAAASIRSAPMRNNPAAPVGAKPNGLFQVRPNKGVDWSIRDTSTR